MIDPLLPVAQLSDRTILELANAKLPAAQTARLALLSAKQRAGTLTDNEPTELGELLQAYSEAWLWRTDALVEAIRRGLMVPTNA
jgi:hypothetical protein